MMKRQVSALVVLKASEKGLFFSAVAETENSHLFLLRLVAHVLT